MELGLAGQTAIITGGSGGIGGTAVCPGGQESTHAALLQMFPVAQARPHPPQWAPLDRVSVSHPLATLPSQLA